MTPYAVGIVLAVLMFLFLRVARFDRDGAAYPIVLLVVAHYYILFAALGATRSTLIAESLGAAVFAILAVVGFRINPWIVVAGLAGHGLYDFVHASLITDPAVPPSWPAFCASFDLGLAAILAWRVYGREKGPRAVSRA